MRATDSILSLYYAVRIGMLSLRLHCLSQFLAQCSLETSLLSSFKLCFLTTPVFLFPDKSMTSVSHLVENELPLASVVVPSTSTSTIDKRLRVSQNSMNELQTSQDLNEIVSEDEHKKSTSGSYNNLLFRENSDGAVDEKLAPDVSQNVYSNIPPTSPSVPNILKNAAADHVYSNIDEANISSAGNGYSLSDNLDLDLDDPLLTSSFIKKKEKPNNHQHVYNAPSAVEPSQNASKLILPSISSSSSTTGTQITSIELKNVLNVVLQKTNQQPTEAKPSTVAPSSLRQTMIDTALDLDSLDGSIGNNSQVALMSNKTAIV